MTDRDALITQLQRHEGIRLKPYQDTVGKWTIGIGRNLSDVGISHAEARLLLDHDIDRVVSDLSAFPWFSALDPIRQRVVADMTFNLGITRFRKFTKTIASIAAGNYVLAADQMLQSKWAGQVGHRAVRLAAMMARGPDYVED